MPRTLHASVLASLAALAAGAPVDAIDLGRFHVDLALDVGAQAGAYRGGAQVTDALTTAAGPTTRGGVGGAAGASLGFDLVDALDVHVTLGGLLLPSELARYNVPFTASAGFTVQPAMGPGRLLVSGDVGVAVLPGGSDAANQPASGSSSLLLALRAAYLFRLGAGLGLGPMVELTRAFVPERSSTSIESGFLAPMQYVGGGVMVRFGGMALPRAASAPAPAPAPVAPPAPVVTLAAAPADRDGDGVLDGRDRCPDEPAGSRLDPDRLGCPRAEMPVTPAPTAPVAAVPDALAPVVVAFDDESATPRESPENGRALTAVASFLGAHPEVDLVVVESGVRSHRRRRDDDALSTRRAEGVRDALLRAGVAADRVVAAGYGDRCVVDGAGETVVRVARVRGALAEGARFGCEAAARRVPEALRPAGDRGEHRRRRHHH